MTRALHPGELLRAVMQRRGISVDDLVKAGLPREWLTTLLRRMTELDTQRPHIARTAQLADATGTPLAMWVYAQRKWQSYCLRQYADLEQRRHQARQRHMR